jgi:hypothetical protein
MGIGVGTRAPGSGMIVNYTAADWLIFSTAGGHHEVTP